MARTISGTDGWTEGRMDTPYLQEIIEKQAERIPTHQDLSTIESVALDFLTLFETKEQVS